jgi:hypothetical protein
MGLVTHPQTKYPDLFWKKYVRIMHEQEKKGNISKLVVFKSNKNYTNEKKYFLASVILGRWANLSLNISWNAYLKSEFKYRRLKKWGSALLDLVKFILKLLMSKSFRINEMKSFIRHQNISLSHKSVFVDAELNDSDWALILEDDVCDEDFEFEMLKVLKYIKGNDFSKIDLFINLSDSLSYKQLGVREIVSDSKLILDNPDFFITTKTFHNTTAANLYNKNFILKFNCDFKEEINWCIQRAIPFDWILNHLVLQECGKDLKSIHMTKPFFRQLSIIYGNT